MRRLLLISALTGGLFIAGTPGEVSAAPGCRAFGEFIAGSAQAPGPFGELVQERVPDFSEDVAQFQAALCAP